MSFGPVRLLSSSTQSKLLTARSPRDFFSQHASDYAKSVSHATGEDLRLLVELLRLHGTESALDVATGTGFTALKLAPSVRTVLAVDLTSEMVAEARNLARKNKIENMSFCLATIESLPFRAGSFDVLTCRRAAHHFRQIGAFLGEATRVLRPGGKIGVADMSPVPGSEDFLNKIDSIRDSTHARALTEKAWLESFARAGLEVDSAMTVSAYVEFEKWLYPVKQRGSDEIEIRRLFDLAPGGLRELLAMKFDGKRLLGFTKTWLVVVGTTPGG